LFAQARDTLEAGDLPLWQQQVSGKYVLLVLHGRFPPPPHSKGQLGRGDYLNWYLDKCPEPPPDLTALVERILNHARHA
jgi:hypothetical protein